MGFAFNMDELAERGAYAGINIGWNPISPKAAREAEFRRQERKKTAIYEASMQYKKAVKTKDVESARRTKQQIETEMFELENALYYFRVCEKNLLKLINKYEMESMVLLDIIDGLLDYFND